VNASLSKTAEVFEPEKNFKNYITFDNCNENKSTYIYRKAARFWTKNPFILIIHYLPNKVPNTVTTFILYGK